MADQSDSDIENQRSSLYTTNSEEDVHVEKVGLQRIKTTPLKQLSLFRKLSTVDDDDQQPSYGALVAGSVYSEQAVIEKIVKLGPKHPSQYLPSVSWFRWTGVSPNVHNLCFDHNTAVSVASDPGYRDKIRRVATHFEGMGSFPEVTDLVVRLLQFSECAVNLCDALRSCEHVDENGVFRQAATNYLDQMRLSAPWHDWFLEWIDALERGVATKASQ